jgi:choline dehydrogenase-like flavoprotein
MCGAAHIWPSRPLSGKATPHKFPEETYAAFLEPPAHDSRPDRVHPAPGDRADVCIVGAGAAGILLAVELARHGRRVVMLEGGGEDIEQASQDTYRSEIAGLRHHGIHDGRFRAIGGSTTRWGGQILEFDAIDFEQRPWVEGSGWPISKRELAPYYQRAIELEGLASASLEDATVWRELGLAQPVFSNLDTFLTRWCPETNFSNLHASTLRNHPLVTVWLHANAVSPSWKAPMFAAFGAEHWKARKPRSARTASSGAWVASKARGSSCSRSWRRCRGNATHCWAGISRTTWSGIHGST